MVRTGSPQLGTRLSARTVLAAGLVAAAALSIGEAAAVAKPPIATGSFIQLDSSLAQKSAAWWQSEIGAMAAVGMDSLVVQYVAVDDAYFYPTSVPGGSSLGVDAIERILAAADQQSMSVYLGLPLDTAPLTTGTFDLAANLQQGQATLTELAGRYGGHSSLTGWYNPQELSDFVALDGSQATLRAGLTTYIHDLAALGRSAAGLGRPTMIAPYFGVAPNAQAYAQWWDTTGLASLGVDVVALQDGVGTHRTTIAESQAVFAALAPVMAGHGVAFWGISEAFDQTHGYPIDNQSFQAVPTAIGTFTQQLSSTNPHVSKSLAFEFSHYLSPQRNAATKALYDAYAAYYPTAGLAAIAPDSYAYGNAPTAAFHGSAGDPSLTRLTDGNLGSTAGGPGSAFANGTWVGIGDDGSAGGPQPRVVLDLGGEFTVGRVEMTYLVDASSSIFAPQPIPGGAAALSIAASIDGTSFVDVAATNDFAAWTTDLAAGTMASRTVAVDLGGVEATHLALDVRTSNTWIFLGEIRIFQAPLPGDFNSDGVVDANDLTAWAEAFGTAGPCGDANADHKVDGADFLSWQRSRSAASAAAASPVAEPRSLMLAVATCWGASGVVRGLRGANRQTNFDRETVLRG